LEYSLAQTCFRIQNAYQEGGKGLAQFLVQDSAGTPGESRFSNLTGDFSKEAEPALSKP
jgi:hypothetical protein